MQKKTSNTFIWAITFIVCIPLVISVILAWVGYGRIKDFESNQDRIARSTVEITSEDIGNIIEENHRLVKLFAKIERAMIARLAVNPDDYGLRGKLQTKIKEFFPHSFAFTIADTKGNPLLDDFDGFVGDICIDDMREMIATHKYAVRIHPNAYVYHYDSMATWEYKGKRGIFFVSFAPEMIARMLHAASPAGHELMLLIKQQGYLMEITEKGARNVIARNDYRLTPQERSRILEMLPVRDSKWHLADLANPDLFSKFHIQTYRTYGLLILTLIIIAIVFSLAVLHFERKRQLAESMRDEMLSLFSHDLRSPLIGIKGATELLKEHGSTIDRTKKQHLYRLIHDYVMHMGRIVDDILDVHRLENGKMEFRFEQTSLQGLLSQALEMMEGYATQFKVKLVQEHDISEDISIYGDRQRLLRAITNLIINALKFSPAGESISVVTARRGDKVVISVADHGPGIPLSLQPHVFQKFVQSRKRQVHNLPSTGLGLTIVKYIIEAHGGRVYFESTYNKGTTFYIELPGTASGPQTRLTE